MSERHRPPFSVLQITFYKLQIGVGGSNRHITVEYT